MKLHDLPKTPLLIIGTIGMLATAVGICVYAGVLCAIQGIAFCKREIER